MTSILNRPSRQEFAPTPLDAYPQLPLTKDERLCRWLGNIARLMPTPFDLLPDMQNAQAYPHKYWRYQCRLAF